MNAIKTCINHQIWTVVQNQQHSSACRGAHRSRIRQNLRLGSQLIPVLQNANVGLCKLSHQTSQK